MLALELLPSYTLTTTQERTRRLLRVVISAAVDAGVAVASHGTSVFATAALKVAKLPTPGGLASDLLVNSPDTQRNMNMIAEIHGIFEDALVALAPVFAARPQCNLEVHLGNADTIAGAFWKAPAGFTSSAVENARGDLFKAIQKANGGALYPIGCGPLVGLAQMLQTGMGDTMLLMRVAYARAMDSYAGTAIAQTVLNEITASAAAMSDPRIELKVAYGGSISSESLAAADKDEVDLSRTPTEVLEGAWVSWTTLALSRPRRARAHLPALGDHRPPPPAPHPIPSRATGQVPRRG